MPKKVFSLLASLVLLAIFVIPVNAGNPAAPATGSPIGHPYKIGDMTDQGVDATNPAIAYNTHDHEYMVVWWNDRPGCDDVYGQRVTINAGPVGPRFAVVSGCPGSERWYPDIAYNTQANEYLLVWNDSATPTTPPFCIRGQRLSAAGAKLGGVLDITNCASSTTYGFNPKVDYGSTPNTYLVVWSSRASTVTYLDVMGQVITAGGVMSGGSKVIAQGSASVSMEYPDLAYNYRSNGYLVAWQQREISLGVDGIFSRLVYGDGTPKASGSVVLMEDTTPSNYPAVAAMPTAGASGQYLVVWQDSHTSTNRDIWGRVMDYDGNYYTNFFRIGNSVDDTVNPSVAANNATLQYLVTWTTNFGSPAKSRIDGQLITPSMLGTSLDNSVMVGGFFADHSSLAGGPNGDFLIAFDDPAIAKHNIWGSLWGNRLYLPEITY